MITWFRSWMMNIARSAYDAAFYAERIKKHYPKAIRHLYGALFLTSLITSIAIAVMLVRAMPMIRHGIDQVQQTAPTLYPAELVIEVKNGEVHTNVKEPYTIEFPGEWADVMNKTSTARKNNLTIQHLMTIDTSASAEDFSKYDSLILLTKRSFVVPDKDGGLRVGSLENAEDLLINKEKVDDLLSKVLPYLNYVMGILWVGVVILVLILPFALAGLRLLGYFVYLLIFVTLLWIIGMFAGIKRRYAEIYWLATYGLTVPLIYGMLEFFFSFHVSYAFTTIFVAWMIYLFTKLPKGKSAK